MKSERNFNGHFLKHYIDGIWYSAAQETLKFFDSLFLVDFIFVTVCGILFANKIAK
jgi:hypothetical protein